MRNKWSLREDNRGVSLIAVVVIMIVVSVIGVAVTELTVTNIEMKEMERAGKVQFYSTEELTDELSMGLNELAAKCMRDAYIAILSDYRDTMTTGVNVQKKFKEVYMAKLKAEFQDGVTVQNIYKTAEDTTVIYEIGDYKTELVKNCLKAENRDVWKEPEPNDHKYHIDYENGVFVLKNLCIQDTDERGYETVIHTDIVFHTPELNFKGSSSVKGFMRYALIADRQILVDSPNITVNGNAYAGPDGILCDHGSAAFNGNTTVTRGYITAKPGANLTVGTENSKVWAENVETAGTGDPSTLNLKGNCYIADDMNLSGRNCTVTVDGSYYGYNFQDNYTGVRTNTDASFSSAIMINGQNSKLDLTQTDYLLLSGRTYIARGGYGTNQDVPLGESLSLRSNQMAYYVPTAFLDTTKNPVVFLAGGEEKCSQYLGVPDVANYLDLTKPVVGYHYVDGGTDRVAYYLNFATEQSANDFFAVYAAANNDVINNYGSAYAAEDALILSDTMSYSLRGDLMYRDKNVPEGSVKPLTEQRVIISGGWDEGHLYWNYANSLAMSYKALQISLEEQADEVDASNVRFVSGSVVDKNTDPLMDRIIDRLAMQAKLAANNPAIEDADTAKVVVLAEGNYSVPAGYTGGIIIATGDVTLNNNFRGMVISGGIIRFVGNVTVEADEMLVAQMFSEDNARPSPVFADIFKGYSTFSDSVIGQVEIDKYLTYDNWTKTEE